MNKFLYYEVANLKNVSIAFLLDELNKWLFDFKYNIYIIYIIYIYLLLISQ